VDRTSSTGHQRGGKGREAFRTISEVAEQLDLPQHVLRFWESKFSQVKPLKRGGNRRYYRPDDVTLLTAIKKLLHADGYTIRGVQKLFKAQGTKATINLALDDSGVSHLAPVLSKVGQGDNADRAVATEKMPENTVEAAQGQHLTANLASVIERLKALRARLD